MTKINAKTADILQSADHMELTIQRELDRQEARAASEYLLAWYDAFEENVEYLVEEEWLDHVSLMLKIGDEIAFRPQELKDYTRIRSVKRRDSIGESVYMRPMIQMCEESGADVNDENAYMGGRAFWNYETESSSKPFNSFWDDLYIKSIDDPE